LTNTHEKPGHSAGRQLLILRHGKSDWDNNTDDFHRPLKKSGVEAAQKIGRFLLEHELIPDHIVSSPALRALGTAMEVVRMMGPQNIHEDDNIYEAGVDELLEVVGEIPESCDRALIIGHNPGLDELLLYLATVPQRFYKDWKLMTTATLAIVDLPSGWGKLEKHCGEITALVRGREL